MPTILLINDDGIQSAGLTAAKTKLEKLGRVVVIAPEEERSGIGKALTTSNHVQIRETKLSDGSKAYATNGTPADAFLLAINKILKQQPDLLVAGINLGPNLGIDDLLNSGTLGAALEAAIHHVPAMAVSYCKQKIRDQKADKARISLKELEPAANLTQKIAKYVLERGMPPDVDILSINVPEKADCKRVKATNLSYIGYRDIYTKEKRGYRIASWILSSYPNDKPETDVYVVKNKGCVSITPIKLRLVHNKKALESLLKSLAS